MLHARALFRRLVIVALSTGALTTTLSAQLVEKPSRPATIPPPPPPRPTARAMKAGPPGAPAATGISGMEVVAGPMVDVASLAEASASAQCPTGKVALSAGVEFTAPGQASFGLEVKGAWPDGRLATVRVRNANVAVPARARAFAVCVMEIPGLRAAYFGGLATARGDDPVRIDGACNANELVVGGGVMGQSMTIVTSNAPDGASPGVWHQLVMPASPVRLPGSYRAESRILCAPASAVDGWEIVTSVPVALGARSQSTLSTSCPAGKVLLAAGVLQTSTNYIDIVASSMIPSSSGSSTAFIQNRNTLGSAGTVDAKVSALCARRQ